MAREGESINIMKKLKPGVRYCEENRVFEFRGEWLEQDLLSNKTDAERTELEVRKAMNSISKDLVFTTETESDFPNKRLPTLSFQMWSERQGIRHSYFEKDMRSQILTMKQSSQSEQSKFNILVNELTRRFEVLDKDITVDEKIDIVDHYTQQLVNSGYGLEQIKEIVESSLKGILRKEERRKMSEERYRNAKETLQERNMKKLTENTTWFREKENNENEETSMKMKEKDGAWSGWRKNNGKRKRKCQNIIDVEGKKKVMSVIFVAHTEKSEMVKRMREKLSTLEKIGNLKFKLVEKTGNKLENILHKSNAWGDEDCCRNDCIMCGSAGENEKKGQCKKRNVVYETYCLLCEEKERNVEKEKKLYSEIINSQEKNVEKGESRKRKRISNEKGESEKERKEKRGRKEYSTKYIGETGRSGYERGIEHVRDFENCEETSHLLKHYIIFHKDVKKSEMKFGMRLRNCYRSPIERQVGEAIAIDREKRKGTVLMNSKSEYNRCQIARISTLSKSESKKEIEKETEEEKRYKEEIKEIRRKKREKRIEKWSKLSNNKRRKLTDLKGTGNCENWSDEEEKEEKSPKKSQISPKKSPKSPKPIVPKTPKKCLEKSDQPQEKVPKSNQKLTTPPDAEKKLPQVLVEKKIGVAVKSPTEKETPPPPDVGTMVTQILEDPYNGVVVKSPNSLKNPPSDGGNLDPHIPEDPNFGIVVKSDKEMEPPTPDVGTMVTQILEDSYYDIAVKSPNCRKTPPLGWWKIGPPHPRRTRFWKSSEKT